MARAIWTGSLSFGLVSIPVGLYPAVKNKEVHFHLLHEKDKVRVQQKLVCPAEKKEITRDQTVKGYEIGPDQLVVVDPKELEALAPKSDRIIEIVDFVPLEEIDSIYFEQPYYLMPDERSAKPYKLFYEALQNSKKVGIGRFVMRNKQYLAAIRPMDNLICLDTMYYADEIVPPKTLGTLPENVSVNPRELKMAEQLIDSLATDFNPEKYHDDYREAVLELIDKKAEGKRIITHPVVSKKPEIVDLMSALEASLSEAKKRNKKPAPKHRKSA